MNGGLGEARAVSDEHDSPTCSEYVMSGRDLSARDVTPYPKQQQLARQERRYRRKVASPKRWQAIADAKQGRCRVCGEAAPNELHHIVARAHGGSDTESNIAPLCQHHHRLITERDPQACRAFLESLDDYEYSLMIEVGGENYAERAYGLEYAR